MAQLSLPELLLQFTNLTRVGTGVIELCIILLDSPLSHIEIFLFFTSWKGEMAVLLQCFCTLFQTSKF